MPYLETSPYRAPLWLPGGQVQTIFSSLFRTVPVPPFERFRLATPDGDFILADRLRAAHNPDKTVVVLSHGLEGNSRRKYMRGMCLAFQALGWDCLSRNFRTCGGEINGTPGMYHSGQTEDLHCVVDFCVSEGYRRILLVGFSMGGNQTLKYLGEEPERVPPQVAGAAVFSVPCDLTGAARALDRPANAVYRRYFMRTLRRKIRAKHLLYPDLYPLDGLDDMRTFAAFDNAYTAPLHAFASAADYWSKASCLPHLEGIAVPVLLVNALNDPFLSPSCFPKELARGHPCLTLETPAQGGHVGFTSELGRKAYWSETRAAAFFREIQASGR